MSKTTPSCVLWVMLILVVTQAAGRAADEQWQFGSTSSFSSGRYGTDTRTEVLHTPITARRLFDDGDVTFVFPFTCFWGNGGVTVVNGTPVRQQRLAKSAANASRGGRTTDSSGAARTADRSAAARTCGMGDIIVRGRYYLLDERGWAPTIAVRATTGGTTSESARTW